MDIPAALDRFVHRTRLDVLTPYAERRSRNLRWLPLLVLAGLPLGFALWVGTIRSGWPVWAGVAGAMIFGAALIAASVIRLFGPRLFEEWAHPLDERERMLKAQAGNISGAIVTMLLVLGCFYGAFAAVFRTWFPTSAAEWVALGLGVQAFAFTLPVLVASWLQPPPDEEERRRDGLFQNPEH